MNVTDVLKQIGAPDEVVRAVEEAIGSALRTEDEVERLGVDVKMAVVATDDGTGSGEPASGDVPGDSAGDEEKGGAYFSRKISELAAAASARDAEFLNALAVVVRRATPEHYGTLASLLRTTARGKIADEVDALATKMENETRVGYAYPEPEEQKAQDDAMLEQLRQLQAELNELKAQIANAPLFGGSVTRPSVVQPAVAPAAALLELS